MIPEHVQRDHFLTHLLGCENALRAFIAGTLARPEERADMFQEVVLILWRTFPRYDSTRPFLPWAMGTAVRRMKEEYRRARRRPGLLSAEHLDRFAAALTDFPAARSHEEDALAACLAALPEHASRLVQRRYYEDAGIETLCTETGQSPAALYQTLSRLRRRLAHCIRQRLGTARPQPSPAHEN